MKRLEHLFPLAVIAAVCASCTQADSKAPRVIETFPVTGSTQVEPSISEISVTFNEPMIDGNWSWAYTHQDSFPEMKGQPYYLPGLTKNVLPVKLEPNKQYEIWINSEKFKNFKDQAGNSATLFRLIFSTK